MWFFLKSFSYSPHLTLLRYSATRSSSQFLTASGPSLSENSDSVGLAKEVVELGRVGALLEGPTEAGDMLLATMLELLEPKPAGKDDLGASIAMLTVWR
ncbi:hypothetical protein HYQ46_000969 [Verticillium longisporum]|nr:hypothetical protein HYQ46_000969 [Verticillium longisporum]